MLLLLVLVVAERVLREYCTCFLFQSLNCVHHCRIQLVERFYDALSGTVYVCVSSIATPRLLTHATAVAGRTTYHEVQRVRVPQAYCAGLPGTSEYWPFDPIHI